MERRGPLYPLQVSQLNPPQVSQLNPQHQTQLNPLRLCPQSGQRRYRRVFQRFLQLKRLRLTLPYHLLLRQLLYLLRNLLYSHRNYQLDR